LRKGLTLELEPKTQPGRSCDLAVAERHGRRTNTLFVEVQSIQDFADVTKRSIKVADRLVPTVTWVMLNRELLGEMYRIPGDAELGDALRLTQEFQNRCASSTEPEHLALDDVMDLWAVPFGHPAKADLLASGVPDGFRSPAPDDPLRRTLRAVRQKIGQLPTVAPGVIVLRPPRLLMPSPSHVAHVVAAVRQAIASSPQISAVALVDWAFRYTAIPNEARVALGGAVVIHHADRHIFVREVVLIENPIRAYRAGDEVIARLL
jgi:hypothetical protein